MPSPHSSRSTIFLFSLLALVLSAPAAGAQAPTVTHADYLRAERFLTQNTNNLVYRASVNPVFTEGDRFRYRVRVPGGFEWIAVDPARGTRARAFDHAALAAALTRAASRSYEELTLPFTSYEEVDGGRALEFQAEGRRWRCTLAPVRCEEATRPRTPPAAGVASPDGRWVAFRRDDNLWVWNRETGDEVQLTTDGEHRNGYATNSQGWSQGANPILAWSPDSRRIATFRQDEREVPEAYLLRTAEPRAELMAWPYPVPGDSVVPLLSRVVVDVEAREVVQLDAPADHQRTSSCCGLTRGPVWADVEWDGDGGRLAYVSTSRDYRTLTLRVADPTTGAVRDVLTETDSVFVLTNLRSGGVPNWRVLHDSNEFIWFSWKDGWGHLYLHDLETGAEKNRITSGSWGVLDILRVDESRREILFTAVGREAGRDPYLRHLYRVNFDGSGLTLLTPEDADHDVTLTPSGGWFVDTYSRVDTEPVTVLRRTRDGSVVRVLEEADLSELLDTGWTPPEPFRTKGRDGVTDVYGLLIRPSTFDPAKRYPIINAIYPGPQTGSVGTRSFSVSRRGQAHALAELGFIVVLVDAMGTPLRSRSFVTAYYADMGDNGLPDQISAMKELAGRHPWIDLNRVGIYGHSGGGFATAGALLRHPDFFHVGVSGAGNHDNRGYTYYWGERYHGLLEWDDQEGHSYEKQANHLLAGNLKGKLLLTYGTMDSNVHPNTTLLLIDALIRENKDFDLIVMPNRGHGYAGEPYITRRTWDYFVTHLLGAEPPAGFRIGG